MERTFIDQSETETQKYNRRTSAVYLTAGNSLGSFVQVNMRSECIITHTVQYVMLILNAII